MQKKNYKQLVVWQRAMDLVPEVYALLKAFPKIEIIAYDKTLSELKRVIQYGRFESRISMLETSPAEVFAYFMNLVFYVSTPEVIPHTIIEDPFDNLFLALAAENQAHLIISGDKHLLELKAYMGIEIVTPVEGCRVIDRLMS